MSESKSIYELYIKDKKTFVKSFLILLIMSLIYVLPLIIYGAYYLDDIGRSVDGYIVWDIEGRLFTAVIMKMLNFSLLSSGSVIDVSPLPQILAIIILALAAALLRQRLYSNDNSLWSILVVFPVIGSPFFLGNLTFKFDSLPMAISVLFAIVASIDIEGKIKSTLLGSLFLFLSIGFYQATVNVFFSCVILFFMVDFLNHKKFNVSLIIASSIKFIVAYTLYILLKIYHPIMNPYAVEASKMIPFNKEWGEVLLNNINFYIDKINVLFVDISYIFKYGIFLVPLFLINYLNSKNVRYKNIIFTLIIFLYFYLAVALDEFVFILVYLIIAFILFLVDSRYRDNNSLKLMVIILTCGVSIFFTSFFALIFLKNTIDYSRILVGFSIFLVFILLLTYRVISDAKNVGAVLFIPIFYMFFISYGYAAALKSQSKYDELLSYSISKDLFDNGFNEFDYTIFDGEQNKAKIFNNSSKVKIINELVFLNFTNKGAWGNYYLYSNGFLSRAITQYDNKIISDICKDTKPLLIRHEYKVFKTKNKNKNLYLISFDNGVCSSITKEL